MKICKVFLRTCFYCGKVCIDTIDTRDKVETQKNGWGKIYEPTTGEVVDKCKECFIDTLNLAAKDPRWDKAFERDRAFVAWYYGWTEEEEA